jgi:hypothetical protein
MGRLDREAVATLTERAGLGFVRDIAPLNGGANNRVARLDTDSGTYFLKSYFRHPDDLRNRLGAEFAFSQFAWNQGVRCIPQPIACDHAAGLGIFEFIPGEPLSGSTIGAPEVDEALGFFRAVNRGRKDAVAAKLPRGSESCLSLNDHFHMIGCRVARLQTIAVESETDRAAAEFARELVPAWERILSASRSTAALNCLPSDLPIPSGERCVSPSDFGFHNAIRAADGHLRFFDFEYAGWDDPAKMICDFFCQPAVPAPADAFERFARAVAGEFPSSGIHLTRATLLLPLYRVKWVCIMLNEFLPVGSRRREFSGTSDEMDARKITQLAKAKAALAMIQLHSPTRKVA